MDRISIGKRIKYERERMGLSQEDLGNNLSVSKQCISSWENGRNMPDVISMYKLSQIFKVTIEDLLISASSDIQNNDDSNSQNEATIFLTDKELKIINKLRAMAPDKKHAIETLFGVKK